MNSNHAEEKVLSRDEIRGAIFNQKVQSLETTFAGVKIELRQPNVGVVMSRNSDDRKAFMTQMLVDYCFVPGTDVHVFEETDQEMLMAMPFNDDWVRLQKRIDELTNAAEVKAVEAKK